jgi:hypothetical protein
MTTVTMATDQRGLRLACSAVAIASFGVICASSAGPVRQAAGLSLIAALAFAVWFLHRRRFDAIVPAVGLTLAFLILAGLALAAAHVLNTVPVALVAVAATLAAVWAGARRSDPAPSPDHPASDPDPDPDPDPASGPAGRRARLKPWQPLALAGVLIFAAAAVLAVRYSADSDTADTDAASSVAIWAIPSGDQLHVGVEQPVGQGATSLRIVVTEAGATVATWNNVRLAPGQTWEAPALTVTENGPAKVVALHGGTVVASLSSQ